MLQLRATVSIVLRLLAIMAVFVAGVGQRAIADEIKQTDLVGPAGSGAFGSTVEILPNGNFVVTDPEYDLAGIENVGAVYLYDGDTLEVISRLTGSAQFDQVGRGGVTVLANGNFVVQSPSWDGQPGWPYAVGAVTWGSATTGVTGTLSAANSLVGATVADSIDQVIVTLPNGNYLVSSRLWDNGGILDAGAVTWGDGDTGVAGVIGPENSLVGATQADASNQIIVTLPNGNYLVGSSYWDNGVIPDAGAVTWGDGDTGVAGVIGPENSLVGDRPAGLVGMNGSMTILANGHYVVHSINWTAPGYGYGAVTWGDATTGVTGTISGANSLTAAAGAGSIGDDVRPLANGHYVIVSPSWSNAGATNAGAVTWGNGNTGITGTVSPANSLVGTAMGQEVGSGSLLPLPNGNYVVTSPKWGYDAMHEDLGAVTWADGSTGITGAVTVTNSLVGDWAYDRVGLGGLKVLANGNYVVSSPNWHSTPDGNLGAVTWGNGSTGVTGTVGLANSLVGSTFGDNVGSEGVYALVNGHYVVCSAGWSNGPTLAVGATTWANGATGLVGPVSAANSLIGNRQGARASGGVIPLTNGNYVVSNFLWSTGTDTMVGAVTWRNGSISSPGVVDVDNSLVGSKTYDQVGFGGVWPLANGNYVVSSPHWRDGSGGNVGAATWGDGLQGTVGVVDATNSLVGGTAGDAVSYGGVVALANGDFVVVSTTWSNGGAADAGAVTYGVGNGTSVGLVDAGNSIVGSSAGDRVGAVEALQGGGYIVLSPEWDNGSVADAGAVTIAGGPVDAIGPITPGASVLGTAASGGPKLVYDVDETRGWVVVGRPSDKTVTIWRVVKPVVVDPTKHVYIPVLHK